jgi:hypothetical protein
MSGQAEARLPADQIPHFVRNIRVFGSSNLTSRWTEIIRLPLMTMPPSPGNRAFPTAFRHQAEAA